MKLKIWQLYEREYYKTKEDLLALLLKTPILNDFNDIEPVLLIDEDDPSGFLESISQYGEVVYAR